MKLFPNFIYKGGLPKGIKKSSITTINKKRPKNNCNNDRGITVTSTVDKILKIIKT